MKRYILAIVVLLVMFLGWGNVVVGNDCSSYQVGTQERTECNNCIGTWDGSSCIKKTSSQSSSPSNQQSTTTAKPCPDSILKGGIHNSFNRCVCPSGYKDVKGVCMDCDLPDVCCGIELNTRVPFIGKCIEDPKYKGGMSAERAFPTLMGALTQILVTVILIVSFVLILIGGIMIATGNPSGGRKMIMKVVVGLALLGASGVILRLINPNFFG